MTSLGRRSVPQSSSLSVEEPATAEKPSLSDLIDQIGFGPAHVKLAIIGGGSYLADGAELMAISVVSKSVSTEWDLTGLQRGSMVTIVFVGILTGNLLSGMISDWAGRRPPLLLSFVGIFVFSVLSACSVGYWSMAIARLAVGFSFGLGVPAFQTLLTEITATPWRLTMNALGQVMFVVGELFFVCLLWWDDPTFENARWRWLLCIAAIPSFIFLILNFACLVESPRYLARVGRHAEAKDVLRRLGSENSSPLTLFDFSAPSDALEMRRRPRDAFSSQMKIVFGSDMLLSTCGCMFSCFVTNFSYYGVLYAFPRVVTGLKHVSPVLEMLMGCLMEVIGVGAGVVVTFFMPRRPAIKLFLIFQIGALVCFVAGLPVHESDHRVGVPSSAALLFGGFYVMKLAASMGFVVIYQYATEVYPTSARATGFSVCAAGGRVAGMISPLAFETVMDGTGKSSIFFIIIIVLSVINLVVIGAMPYETAGMQLSDEIGK
jgi:MFS family permease